MCRTQWKLKEIEKAQDGTYALYYDTPDGSQKVGQYKSSFLRLFLSRANFALCLRHHASHLLLANRPCSA